MMLTGDPEGFARLTRQVADAAGLALADYKEKVLRRRIAVRMRACGASTFDDYGVRLRTDPGELARLKDALTINVTRFYRNPETWERLRRDVLPGLLAARDGAVRVWSAGCSSGEEPYTLALCLVEEAERAGRPAWAAKARVIATDIDEAIMARARAARYPAAAFLETPPALVERHTRPVPGSDEREVTPALRRMVEIRRHDLLREPPPGPAFDLVVCRNVVIYFDRDGQERLFERFADALAPGGYLLLGKVETLFGPARDRLELVDVRERIFRRPA
ncbi:MAG TPA: protein-glutamate O-methyltransferase CheR [Gemmatimonadales bacterium]|nr:protein-glutamate O-methyltransferase CheR [Gemmatimonadales bacterium]